MNFSIVTKGLHVAPLVAALAANDHLWGDITARQDYPGSAHRNTETIYLRGPNEMTPAEYMGTTTAMDYPALAVLASTVIPVLGPLLEALQASELGYVMIVKLAPGGEITPHIDEGAYADHYSRFHIPLETDAGATLQSGGDTLHLPTGEAWWFNHKQLHSASNTSSAPRLHLIVDAVSPLFKVGA